MAFKELLTAQEGQRHERHHLVNFLAPHEIGDEGAVLFMLMLIVVMSFRMQKTNKAGYCSSTCYYVL